MKVAPTQDQLDKVTQQLGVECVNKAIEAKSLNSNNSNNSNRFRWRDFESVKLLVEQIDALTVPDIVKERIFDNFLPEFSNEIEPMDKI